jgi:hypothetical protein
MNREHLLSLAALTALVTFSQVARADEHSFNTGRFERPEVQTQQTCAQAQASAWFVRQMALPDFDLPAVTPVECERSNVATAATDADAYEESK